MAETRKTGTVKWFSAKRGYGFITDEEGVDYFLHFSEIQMDGFKRLNPGQLVSFGVKEDENGRELAVSVQPEGNQTEGENA